MALSPKHIFTMLMRNCDQGTPREIHRLKASAALFFCRACYLYSPLKSKTSKYSVFIIIIPSAGEAVVWRVRVTRICAGAFINSCFCSGGAQFSGGRAHQREAAGCECTLFAWQAHAGREVSRCYDLISRLMARSARRKLASEVYGVSTLVFIASDNIFLCGYVTKRSTKFSPWKLHSNALIFLSQIMPVLNFWTLNGFSRC